MPQNQVFGFQLPSRLEAVAQHADEKEANCDHQSQSCSDSPAAVTPADGDFGSDRVIESLASVGHKELKKTGVFFVPGFAKFVVIKKPATKERKGINPFTKEPTIFKARPARKVIRARPVKAAKDAVA